MKYVTRLMIVGFTVLLMLPLAPVSAQGGGPVYEDPQGRFTWAIGGGNWQPVETDGSYAHFTLDVPPADMYIATPETDNVETAAQTALAQIGVDPSSLTLDEALSFGPWQALIYSMPDGQNVTIAAQVIDGGTLLIVLIGEEGVITGLRDSIGIDRITFTVAEGALPATVEQFEVFANEVTSESLPGLSVVIALGNDILYANGFGVADGPQGLAATPDTVYMWGSMTKMVTATAVMQLVDQGLVDLDAPVSTYLDYFPAEPVITVRQLLNHSAGLPEVAGDILRYTNLEGQALPDPDQAARTYFAQFTGPSFEPGANAAYSNVHYIMLGQIVAAVSGQAYMDYVREHILTPLGMANTDFTYSSETMIANAASQTLPAADVEGFVAQLDAARGLGDGADYIREVDDQYVWLNRLNNFGAYGGLIGPASDVIRFAQMHLNGGELDGVRILSAEATALMRETQSTTSGAPLQWGLGWFIGDDSEHPYVYHVGSVEVGLNIIRIYPNDGVAVVTMGNSSGYDVQTVTDAAANVVFSLLAGQ